MLFSSEVQFILNGLVMISVYFHVLKLLLRWFVISTAFMRSSFRQFYHINSRTRVVFNYNHAENFYWIVLNACKLRRSLS